MPCLSARRNAVSQRGVFGKGEPGAGSAVLAAGSSRRRGRAEAGSPRPLTCGGALAAATPGSGTRGPTPALPPSLPPCPVRPPAGPPGPPPPPSSRRTRPGPALTFKRLDVAMIPTAGPPRPAAAASLLELGSAPTGRCRFTWPRAARPPGRTRGGGSSSSGGGGLSAGLLCPAATLGELGSAGTGRVLRTQPPLRASWRRPPGRRSTAAAPWKGPGPHDAAPGAAPPPSAAAGAACSAPCRPATAAALTEPWDGARRMGRRGL